MFIVCIHVLLKRSLYDDIQEVLVHDASICNHAFKDYSEIEKIVYIMSSSDIPLKCANTCQVIFDRRRNFTTN